MQPHLKRLSLAGHSLQAQMLGLAPKQSSGKLHHSRQQLGKGRAQ